MKNETINRTQLESPATRFASPPPRPTCRVETVVQNGSHSPLPGQDPTSSIEHPGSSTQPTSDSESPAIQSSNPSIQPVRKRIRNGKIARLPYILRDMVNRMLRDHIPYASICEAVLEKGVDVTERNISNWKTRGGYEAWRLEQERALGTRLFQDNLTDYLRKIDGAQLPEVGLQLAATHLSAYFLKPETQQQLSTDPQKCSEAVSVLCRVARQVHNLQKFRDETAKNLSWRHDHERIKRANEKHAETTREVYSAKEIDDKTIGPIPRRNYMPRNWDTLPEPVD